MAEGNGPGRVVAVDVGTTLVKAVRYDDAGREAALARRPVAVGRPNAGWCEQDADAVWQAVAETVREVAATPGPDVAALAITAQGDGLWLVDHDGRPAGPAMLWNDGRATDVLEQWRRDGVLDEAARAGNPSRVTAGMSAPLLRWLERHDTDVLDRSASALSAGGWVMHRLTGERWLEESDASAPLLDPAAADWSDALLDLYGLRARRRLLPTVVRAGASAPLTEQAAGELGLPAGTPVVLAPYDVCTTAIGAGALEPGDGSIILGTTIATQVVVDRVAPRETEGIGITVSLGAPGRWLRSLPTMTGGEALQWGARLLGVDDAPALLDLAADAAEDTAGVRFLPYLAPAGERAPFADARARGSLTGLSLDAEPADVARAMVDGLSLTVLECLDLAAAEGVDPSGLAVCGGGAASDLWTGVLAEVCGLPVRRCADSEVGARGAMLVALVALGDVPDLGAAAAAHVRLGEPVEPREGAGARWAERLAEQRALRETLAPTWAAR
ncbi:FGGY-family carbohydrate kinase [Nocardioides marinquilinus]|uniref:FGGY-family carbohydrate kinase n=1 Tax=Nocardioides marinquilinus TaxID=1210400 RepID=A0ABP9Q7V2_9ACTN